MFYAYLFYMTSLLVYCLVIEQTKINHILKVRQNPEVNFNLTIKVFSVFSLHVTL